MDGMGLLPLFPLGTVLAPGRRLPLRVFEPRYVAMLRHLLSRDEAAPRGTRPQPPLSEFGVVALRRGTEVGAAQAVDVHEIGCRARIVHMASLGDGTFQVMAIGVGRFRLERLHDARTPYLVGEVTPIEEPAVDRRRAALLAAEVTFQLGRYRALLGGDVVMSVPDDPTALSYRAVDALVLDVSEQQSLLESPDTLVRLGLALRLARRELALVASLNAVPHRYDAEPPTLN